MTTLFNAHRQDSSAWHAFRWIHAHTREWRLWPATLLAILGVGYALYHRQGLLTLPAAMNLACALPLCLMFLDYDRYFLPAEALLLLQGAVGIRAATELSRAARRRAARGREQTRRTTPPAPAEHTP